MPKAVIVKFDKSNIGKLAKQSSSMSLQSCPDGISVLPTNVKEHVGRSESSLEIVGMQLQLPIDLCWVCTFHKVQGTHLNGVVI